MKYLTFWFLILGLFEIYAQENNYSLSFKGENLIPFLFESEDNDRFLIIRKKSEKIFYRVTLGYDYLKDERVNSRVGIGFDKIFDDSKKWSYRYGFDLVYLKRNYTRINEKFSSLRLNPFLRIDFKLSQKFFISFEPTLSLLYNKNVDNSSRIVKNNYEEYAIKLNNLGQVLLSFNFM